MPDSCSSVQAEETWMAIEDPPKLVRLPTRGRTHRTRIQQLQEWLGPEQAWKLQSGVSLIEVFAGQSNLSWVHEKGGGIIICIGKVHGHDLSRPRERALLCDLARSVRAPDLWCAWPCTHLYGLSNINLAKVSTHDATAAGRHSGLQYVRFFKQLWKIQESHGHFVHGENPRNSLCWQTAWPDSVQFVTIYQRGLGLKDPRPWRSELHVQKPTTIVSNSDRMIMKLQPYARCPGGHQHGGMVSTEDDPGVGGT